MLKLGPEIITGHGSFPAEVGLVAYGQNINLLNMPNSGFEFSAILETPKLAHMNFIGPGLLRVAVSEFGLFKSSSILIFDVDLQTNKVFILSTYHFDITANLELLSLYVLPSGDVIAAARKFGVPCLVFCQNGFEQPVFYPGNVCTPDVGYKPLFDFVLPTMHNGQRHEIPGSYSILQFDGSRLVALVSGIAQSFLTINQNPSLTYGFAIFDINTLDLFNINTLTTGSAIPSMFNPSKFRGGFVGGGDNLIVQFVGERKSPLSGLSFGLFHPHFIKQKPKTCHDSEFPYYLDGIVREINPITLKTVSEINYKRELGSYLNIYTQDIRQASIACLGHRLILAAEDHGLYVFDKEAHLIRPVKSVAMIFDGSILYSLELTHLNLRFVSYIF